jgi:hypothetical protein
MSNSWIVIVFMLFFVLVMALYLGSQSYNAYIPSGSGLSEYPYEGFAASQNAFENREGLEHTEKSLDQKHSLPESSLNSKPSNPFSSFVVPKDTTSQKIATTSTQPASDSTTSKTDSFATFNKEGFESTISKQISEGVITGASYSDQKPIGFMYNNQGSPTCKNYGYTNSQGFICMSEGDIQLLTTRGGNASGASDQIGK